MTTSLVIGEPGSSQLISVKPPPAKRYKLGVVSISANDIATELKALREDLMLHPVILKPSTKDDTVKNALFSKRVGFSTIEGLQVIVDTSVNIPFFILFDDKSDMRELSINLFPNMHNLIIQQFGLASTREILGESTEMHKEAKDKEALRELLAVLLPSPKNPMPTIFTDEVTFTPPIGPGPNGQLDLLIGVQVDATADDSAADDSAADLFDIPIVVKVGNEDILLESAVLAESKQLVGDLGNKALSDKPDSSSTLQPIVQLLSVSQLPGFKKRELSVLFYGTRRFIRPYIYYHSQDILLTTADPLQWKKETGLDLRGTTAIAALLTKELKFKESIGQYLLESRNLTQTGFMKAMEDATVCLADSTLQSARMPPNRHNPPAPSQSHADPGFYLSYEKKFEFWQSKQ